MLIRVHSGGLHIEKGVIGGGFVGWHHVTVWAMFSDKLFGCVGHETLLGSSTYAGTVRTIRSFSMQQPTIPKTSVYVAPCQSSFRLLPFLVILVLFMCFNTMVRASITVVASETDRLIITMYDTKGVYV